MFWRGIRNCLVSEYYNMDVSERLLQLIEEGVECARDQILIRRNSEFCNIAFIELNVRRLFCEWVAAYLEKVKAGIDIYIRNGVFVAPGRQGVPHVWIQLKECVNSEEKIWIIDPFGAMVGRTDMVVSSKRWKEMTERKCETKEIYELSIFLENITNPEYNKTYLGGEKTIVDQSKVESLSGKRQSDWGACRIGLDLYIKDFMKTRFRNYKAIQEMLKRRFNLLLPDRKFDTNDFVTIWIESELYNLMVLFEDGGDRGKIESACARLDKIWENIFGLENVWNPYINIFLEPSRLGSIDKKNAMIVHTCYHDILEAVHTIGSMTDNSPNEKIRSLDVLRDTGSLLYAFSCILRIAICKGQYEDMPVKMAHLVKYPFGEHLSKRRYPSCVTKAFQTVIYYHMKLYYEDEDGISKMDRILSSVYEIWINILGPEWIEHISNWFRYAKGMCLLPKTQKGNVIRYDYIWHFMLLTDMLDQKAFPENSVKTNSDLALESDSKSNESSNSNSVAIPDLLQDSKELSESMLKNSDDNSKMKTRVYLLGAFGSGRHGFSNSKLFLEVEIYLDEAFGNSSGLSINACDTAVISSVCGNKERSWNVYHIESDGAKTNQGGYLSSFLQDFSLYLEVDTIGYIFIPTQQLFACLSEHEELPLGEIIIPFMEKLYDKNERTLTRIIRYLEWSVNLLMHPKSMLSEVFIPWPEEYQIPIDKFRTDISESEEWVYHYQNAEILIPIFSNLCIQNRVDFHFINSKCLRVTREQKALFLGTVPPRKPSLSIAKYEQKFIDMVWKWMEDENKTKISELFVSEDMFTETFITQVKKRGRNFPIAKKHIAEGYTHCQKLFQKTFYYGMSFLCWDEETGQLKMVIHRTIMEFFDQQITSAIRLIKDNMKNFKSATGSVVMSRGFLIPELREKEIPSNWSVYPWSHEISQFDIYIDSIKKTLVRLIRSEGYMIGYASGKIHIRPTLCSILLDSEIEMAICADFKKYEESNQISLQRTFHLQPCLIFDDTKVALRLSRTFTRWLEESFFMFGDETHTTWTLAPFSSLTGELIAFTNSKRMMIDKWILDGMIDLKFTFSKNTSMTYKFGNLEIKFLERSFGINSTHTDSDILKEYRTRKSAALDVITENSKRKKGETPVKTEEEIHELGRAFACYRFYEGVAGLDLYPDVSKWITKSDYVKYLMHEYYNYRYHHPIIKSAILFFDPKSNFLDLFFDMFDIEHVIIFSDNNTGKCEFKI